MGELQRRIATAELQSAIGGEMPEGWLSFVAPVIGFPERDEFFINLAELLGDFRKEHWPVNKELLAIEKYANQPQELLLDVRDRFEDPIPLANELSGNGAHILSTGLLAYAPDVRGPISLDDLKRQEFERILAVQPVAVDISGSNGKRSIKYLANYLRLPKGLKDKVYTALFGGLETVDDMSYDTYASLAIQSLQIITSGKLKKRIQTMYLADADNRATQVYAGSDTGLGFTYQGMSQSEDPIYGPIKVYRGNVARTQ